MEALNTALLEPQLTDACLPRSRVTTSRQRRSQPAPTPPLSPSLRTYGTFGRIQNSLASLRDIDEPVAPTPTEKESNQFSNSSATLAYGQPLSKVVDTAQLGPPPPPLLQVAGIGDGWDLDMACPAWPDVRGRRRGDSRAWLGGRDEYFLDGAGADGSV